MSITLALVVVTALISYRAFSDPTLKANLIFHPATIKNRGEFYRFITSGFIHADFNHLLFNMFGLYIFGSTTEMLFVGPIFGSPLLGRMMFLVFYLSAIAAASYVDFIRHQNNSSYAALGASGGVAAIMWPYVFFAPWAWFIFPPLPAIIIGPAFILYSRYADQNRRSGDNTGHNAHMWGAIFGLVFYLVLLIFRSPELLERFMRLLMMPQGPGYF